MSSSLESPIFTDLFLPLYLKLMEDSLTSAASPDTSFLVLSPAHDLPVLDLVAPPSPEPLIGLNLRCSIWVSIPSPYLTNYHCSFALAALYEPYTFRENHTNPLWQQAMSEELDAFHKNHAWDMVNLPPSQSVVDCRWVYKIQTKVDGFVEQYKARLVAKGLLKNMALTTRKHLLLLLSLYLSDVLLLWPSFVVGLFIRWM